MDDFDLTHVEVPEFDPADLLSDHERMTVELLAQMAQTLNQQSALLAEIARRLGPKRLVRDPNTRAIVGVEPAE